jgi:hypothetical protein
MNVVRNGAESIFLNQKTPLRIPTNAVEGGIQRGRQLSKRVHQGDSGSGQVDSQPRRVCVVALRRSQNSLEISADTQPEV